MKYFLGDRSIEFDTQPEIGTTKIKCNPMSSYFNYRVLQKIFETVIFPWAHSGSLQLVVAEPDWVPPENIRIVQQQRRASASEFLPSQHDSVWSQLGLHLRPHPLLLFILDGEADICIGHASKIEDKKQRAGRQKAQKYEVSVFSLPAQSCLIVPPDVAHSDGSTPHWERPLPENARSQILWLQILPMGTLVHLCQTKGTLHTHASTLFVNDLQLAPLMKLFLDRANQVPRSDSLLSSFMLTLLYCFEHSGARNPALVADVTDFEEKFHSSQNAPYHAGDSQAAAFEQACFFIDSHLTDALSPAQIARHAHTSVSQLSRIFHARFEMPVMKYVTQRRLEEARNLLLRTNLTVQEVGEICGYPHRTHFSRVFKEQIGLSPHIFRRQAVSKKVGENS